MRKEEVSLVWEEPTNRGQQRDYSVYDPLLEQIKARPDAWARIVVCPTQSPAYRIKDQLTARATDARWEFKTSALRNDKGETEGYGVYARYRAG